MNQIIQMFKDSNTRMQKIMKGSYNADAIRDAQREFEGQIKLANTVIQAYAVMSKNARAKQGLKNLNMIDDDTAIDLGLGSPEIDKVKCPVQEKLIYRSDCLDYSGDHYDECKRCEIGSVTKEKLLGQ